MAGAILWFLSDEASFVTGAMLDAAGGGYIIKRIHMRWRAAAPS